MNRLRKLAVAAGLLVLVSACENKAVSDAALESEAGYSDVAGVKLKVGEPAPLFSLTSMDGTSVALSDFRGGGVVLIFYRGEWCPFCVSHLEDINTVLPQLSDRGVNVIAISPDDIAGLQEMANRMDNPYIFLSDPNLEVIERYGIRRDEKLPHPAVIVVDKKGIVQWFYVGEDYKQRPSASQLMQVIERLPSL